MDSMDIPSLTIDRVRQALLSREYSARELTALALRFAQSENPKTNAYLHFCPERAMGAPQLGDERIARGEDPACRRPGIARRWRRRSTPNFSRRRASGESPQ